MRPRPVVLSHDISEGPSFARLTRSGVDCLAILHVDVVDYFQRFYLGDLLPASWWTWLHSASRHLPWPDVLQLVFEKQLQAARSCRYLIVPSQPMKDILQRCYPEVRVEVVPWGSPVESVQAQPLDWELDERAPLLVTLSRIAPEKGQDLLLRALKVGEERGEIPPGLTLAIVGAPSYMMGQRYLAKLRKLASQLRRVRVIFPGHLGGGAKQAVLERASVFVVCSRHESYGLTIMEAMSAGCPIVAVPSYGVAATVDESCARICAGDSPAALWQQISLLLGDPPLRASLGQAARAKALGCGFDQAADRLWKLCQGHHRVIG
jgi:glycosyltransferase involved in cell wall biosynthesis